MERGTVNCITDFFENASEIAEGMFIFLKNPMNSLQLDWKRVSDFSADNVSCKFWGQPFSV